MGKYVFGFDRIWNKWTRKKYWRNAKLRGVRDAVETAVAEGLLEDPYRNYRDMKPGDIDEAELHAAPGTELQAQGGHVLEFDIGGSGFVGYRADHVGIAGNRKFVINGERIYEEDLNREDEPVRFKNRMWPWLRWIFNIPSAEEVMARNELMHEKKRIHEEMLRKRAAEIRADREKKAARMAERAQAEVPPSTAPQSVEVGPGSTSPVQNVQNTHTSQSAYTAQPARDVKIYENTYNPADNIQVYEIKYSRMPQPSQSAYDLQAENGMVSDSKYSTVSAPQPVRLSENVTSSVPVSVSDLPRGEEAISAADELMQSRYGKHTKIEGLADKKYIFERNSDVKRPDGTNVYKTRFSIAGAQGGEFFKVGALNRGEYSIQNISEYMLTAGKSYLTKVFEEWDKGENQVQRKAGISPITIMMRGHSRGAVAAIHGAMMLKQWIHENYKRYEERVNFKVLQMDPVPGFGSDHGLKSEVSLLEEKNKDLQEEMKKRKMELLGPNADTTVVYSMHTNHKVFFAPQKVNGAKRIILTSTKHDVNLKNTDSSQIGYGDDKVRRDGFFDLETKKMYRGSGLHELPEGVYIADENNCLIRVPNYETGKRIMDVVLNSPRWQKARHRRIKSMMKDWFEAHPKQAEAKPSEGTRKRILLFEDDEKQSRHNRSRTKTQEHQLKLLNPAMNGMKK